MKQRLQKLLADAGLTPGQAIRKREALYTELGLADADDDGAHRGVEQVVAGHRRRQGAVGWVPGHQAADVWRWGTSASLAPGPRRPGGRRAAQRTSGIAPG